MIKQALKRLASRSHTVFRLAERARQLETHILRKSCYITSLNVITGLIYEEAAFYKGERQEKLSLLSQQGQSELAPNVADEVAGIPNLPPVPEVNMWGSFGNHLEEAMEIALLVGDVEINPDHLILTLLATQTIERCIPSNRLQAYDQFYRMSKCTVFLRPMLTRLPKNEQPDIQSEMAEILAVLLEDNTTLIRQLMERMEQHRSDGKALEEKPDLLELRAARLLNSGNQYIAKGRHEEAALCSEFILRAVEKATRRNRYGNRPMSCEPEELLAKATKLRKRAEDSKSDCGEAA
jgi:hypothetical protein